MGSVRSLTPEDHARPHPVYAVWELTLRCDQACRHCGSRAGVARADELDTAGALDLVAQLGEAGVREVTLIGGEAYLRPDWLEIIRAIRGAGMGCSLVSGGRALTPDRARAAVAAGVTSVSISVDGLPPTHDALRAVPGSFDAAMAALDAVREAGAAPTVNTQINLRNRDELEALSEHLLARGVRAWQFQLTTPMGRAADQDRLTLQPWHLVDLMPRLARLATATRTRGCRLIASNNLGYFGPEEGDLRLGGHWIGCPGGRFSIGIQSDGRLKACSSLPADTYAADSVRARPLADQLAAPGPLRAVGDRGTEDLWGFCADCYYAEICRGGCVWTAHTFLGRPGNQPFCHHRALTLKGRGLRERVVPVAPAPGRAFDHGRWEVVVESWGDED